MINSKGQRYKGALFVDINCFQFRGEKAFPTADSINYGGEGKVPEEAIDRMVNDLGKQ